MPERKSKQKRKPKNYDKLSQKEKFIKAAKETDADETGQKFDEAVATVLPVKKRDC